MKGNISNEEIYKKLVEIEKHVKNLLEEQKLLEKEEKLLKEEEIRELGVLKKLSGKDIKRKFDDMVQWRTCIWDRCPDKKAIMDKETIDYQCKKTGKTCRFIDCYRNKE